MEFIKLISLLLLVLATAESQRSLTTIMEKPLKARVISRMILKESVPYIETETSENGIYYLYKIKKLSPKGRYFNQTEADFAKVKPGCPCVNKPSECDSNCCYCKLKCPMPENSFTGELMFPVATNCSKDEMTSSHGKKEIRPLLPWLCDRTADSHDDVSRFATLMCIHDVNLHSVNIFYNLNPGRTDEDEVGTLKVPLYSWRHISDTRTINRTVVEWEKKSHEMMTLEAEAKVSHTYAINTNETTESTIQGVNGINFTLDNDNGTGYCYIRVLHEPPFSIKEWFGKNSLRCRTRIANTQIIWFHDF